MDYEKLMDAVQAIDENAFLVTIENSECIDCFSGERNMAWE